MDLFKVADIEEIKEKYNIRSSTLIDFSTGFDDCVYLLFSGNPPDRINGSFVNTMANTEYMAVMIAVNWNERTIVHTEFYDLGMHEFNYHFIRPFKDDFLLVGSRCEYFSENNFEKNAIIVGRDGSVKAVLSFGDGIQDVITDAAGRIITSYFDEGIFGNYGWKKPIGRRGLIMWNGGGIPIWENKKYNIYDCYAMNMDSSGHLWFYYYMKFDLVRTDFENDTVMHPDIQGSNAFAVSETQREILFQGGYEEKSFYRYDLKNNEINKKEKVIIEADGVEVSPKRYRFNGSKLLFLTEDKILRAYFYYG